jgi:hypothetical protein
MVPGAARGGDGLWTRYDIYTHLARFIQWGQGFSGPFLISDFYLVSRYKKFGVLSGSRVLSALGGRLRLLASFSSLSALFLGISY